jgi:hypothetical protein
MPIPRRYGDDRNRAQRAIQRLGGGESLAVTPVAKRRWRRIVDTSVTAAPRRPSEPPISRADRVVERSAVQPFRSRAGTPAERWLTNSLTQLSMVCLTSGQSICQSSSGISSSSASSK